MLFDTWFTYNALYDRCLIGLDIDVLNVTSLMESVVASLSMYFTKYSNVTSVIKCVCSEQLPCFSNGAFLLISAAIGHALSN